MEWLGRGRGGGWSGIVGKGKGGGERGKGLVVGVGGRVGRGRVVGGWIGGTVRGGAGMGKG